MNLKSQLQMTGSAAALCVAAAVYVWSAPSRTIRFVPEELGNPKWVSALRAMQPIQAAALTASSTFHDFQFTDRRRESGITFRNQIVDDAGKTYKAAHYDHGNGIAVADVDGDGLPDIYFVSQLGGNQLWKNLGNGRFRNITAEAGVAVAGRISVSATFADVDN